MTLYGEIKENTELSIHFQTNFNFLTLLVCACGIQLIFLKMYSPDFYLKVYLHLKFKFGQNSSKSFKFTNNFVVKIQFNF